MGNVLFLMSTTEPRILFILHLPPPVHGAAMVGQYIKESELINSEFDCHYINLAMAASIEDVGHFRIGKFFDLGRLLKKIRSKVKMVSPSLVYMTPNAKGAAFFKEFLIVMMLKWMGCRVIIHYHNKGVKTVQDQWLYHQLYKRFFRNLKVILLAECLYDDIKKYVSRNDVYICPNGIEEATTETSLSVQPVPQLLFLSNLIKTKGVLDLLTACKILKNQGVSFKCTFIGAESAEITAESFHKEIEDNGLQECVEYAGPKFGADKEAFYNQSDVFVFPTFYPNECFPLVLLEAMQHGLPCVATDEGAIADIIDDGKTGYVVTKKQPTALAEKLEILIKDAELRKNMGLAGRHKYEMYYTLTTFEKRMAEILHNIMKAQNNT